MNKNQKLCPICLKQKTDFEYHHVIWKADGGTNDPVNLLEICKTCHIVLTQGVFEDERPRNMACFYYQMAAYGLDFVERSYDFGFEDEYFLSPRKLFNNILSGVHIGNRVFVDCFLRELSCEKYIQMIAVIQGLVSFNEHEHYSHFSHISNIHLRDFHKKYDPGIMTLQLMLLKERPNWVKFLT